MAMSTKAGSSAGMLSPVDPLQRMNRAGLRLFQDRIREQQDRGGDAQMNWGLRQLLLISFHHLGYEFNILKHLSVLHGGSYRELAQYTDEDTEP